MLRYGKTWRMISATLFFPVFFDCRSGHVSAQGYPPESAIGQVRVPDGFEATLFASEPRIRQPVAIETDDLGRLWVIQYLQYPNPAGLKRVKVDRYSRTAYDRVPEPPPRGPRGEDRVTILEDSDGDGRADASKDFVTGLNLASGIAFGHGGVFILQAPYLLFYPDRDHDDAPDSEPRALLSGFGLEDASSVANSLVWGPDGWLYGAQGSTVSANVRGHVFQQGVWRYHVESDRFEVFYEGGGNTWGLDFDERGNALASTNMGGFVMLHGVPGGYYWKLFEKHGPLSNPHAYGYLDHVPYGDSSGGGFRGGHVTAGGIVYDGDSFPQAFRGKYVAANVLGHAVHWHTLTPRGSTFTAGHGGELLVSSDTWCAPCDVTMAADGAVYVADWYDERTAHPDPDAAWDRTNGRIYRIQAKGARRAPVVDLVRAPGTELVAMLSSSNGWLVRRARRVLQERKDSGVASRLRSQALEGSGRRALEALWTLMGCSGLDAEILARLLLHRDSAMRAWTVRAIAEWNEPQAGLTSKLLELARSEPSPAVRLELACASRRLSGSSPVDLVRELATRSEDANDPFVWLSLWWGLESNALRSQDRVLERFAVTDAWQLPIAREDLLPRLARRYMAEGNPAALDACARILASAPDAAAKKSVVAAFDVALDGVRVDRQGVRLLAPLRGMLRSPPDDPALLRVLVRLGDAEARSSALATALDTSAPETIRLAALRAAGEVSGEDAVRTALTILRAPGSEALHAAAIGVAQKSPDRTVADELLSAYARLGAGLRATARQALLARSAWTGLLLDAIERGMVAAADVSPEEIRLISLHRDVALDARARNLWGSFQATTAEEKLAVVRRLNNDLRAASGDVARGREQFQKHCATCHRLFGDGKEIGPDLTTANRKDRQFLLISLVDPGAQVRKEYLSHIVTTNDGRLAAGRIIKDDPGGLEVIGADGQVTAIARSDVRAVEESPVSLMPEGIIEKLSPRELRDLFAYLEGETPAQKPAE